MEDLLGNAPGPFLIVLAVVTDFRTEVLAALLGTVAGYVLSQSTGDDQ